MHFLYLHQAGQSRRARELALFAFYARPGARLAFSARLVRARVSLPPTNKMKRSSGALETFHT